MHAVHFWVADGGNGEHRLIWPRFGGRRRAKDEPVTICKAGAIKKAVVQMKKVGLLALAGILGSCLGGGKMVKVGRETRHQSRANEERHALHVQWHRRW